MADETKAPDVPPAGDAAPADAPASAPAPEATAGTEQTAAANPETPGATPATPGTEQTPGATPPPDAKPSAPAAPRKAVFFQNDYKEPSFSSPGEYMNDYQAQLEKNMRLNENLMLTYINRRNIHVAYHTHWTRTANSFFRTAIRVKHRAQKFEKAHPKSAAPEGSGTPPPAQPAPSADAASSTPPLTQDGAPTTPAATPVEKAG